MESFPAFFKVRAIVFTCIILISFLWTVLLSVEAYARWDVADTCSRSLTAVLILTNTMTMLMLPFLLLLDFRAWLDAARILFLMTLQIGSAGAFSYWYPQIQCPDQTADQLGVCKLFNMYTLVACWVIPATFILYAGYFAVMVYCQSRIPVVLDSRERPVNKQSISPPMIDPEMGNASPSLPVLNSWALMSPPHISSFDSLLSSQRKSNSVSTLAGSAFPSPVSGAFQPVVLQQGVNLQSSHRHTSLPPSFVDSGKSNMQADNTSSTSKSARLSKPLPPWCI